jgi:hypothetical protein
LYAKIGCGGDYFECCGPLFVKLLCSWRTKIQKRENLYAESRIFDFTVQVYGVQKLMKSHFCMLTAELLRAATLTEPTKIHELKLLYAVNLCAKSSII